MKTLVIVNDPPYGTERAYNALRLANSLLKHEGEEAKLFLIGDAASCAKAGQNVPQGYYSLERMLKGFHAKGGVIGVCSTCMDARGLRDEEVVAGLQRSTLDELSEWTRWADRVLVF
jgi:uncharacterized protein involved in oxidation of intracellular sulfur